MSAQEKTAGGLSRRNLWAYPVGTVGRDMAGNIMDKDTKGRPRNGGC